MCIFGKSYCKCALFRNFIIEDGIEHNNEKYLENILTASFKLVHSLILRLTVLLTNKLTQNQYLTK